MTTTPNYGLTLPLVTGDTAAWGGYLNTNFTIIDSTIFGVANPAGLTVSSTPGSSVKGTLTFQNASAAQKTRWVLVEDVVAESGGNAGSNLSLQAYSDAGGFISTPLAFTRSTGNAVFGSALTVNGATTLAALTTSGAATFGSTLAVTGLATFNGSASIKGGGVSLYSSSTGGPIACTWNDSGGTARGSLDWTSSSGMVLTLSNPVTSFLQLDTTGNFNFSGGGNAFKPSGGVWGTLSDERIKTVTGEYELGLEEVLQLRPVIYIYKGNDGSPDAPSPHAGVAEAGTEYVGFVAQELEQVFPDMVGQREGYIDGAKVMDLREVDVSALIYALVNSVKQLKAEIEVLKAR